MNFGTPVPLLIGIILILGALALFFLEKFRPGYERDSDKVYAVLLLVSGLFLLAHLDMELLASFQQLLMAGMLTALLIESIRNRLPRTEPMQPIDSRPPRPRYDNRQPANRRVYRAELDDRGMPLRDRPYAPRMAAAPDPRMAPVRDEYRRNEYSSDRPRQPYEEFRGPAGRLQPSEAGDDRGRDDRPRDDRYADGNGRYGERPPARPPADRPPSPSPQGYSERRPDDRGSEGRGSEGRGSEGRGSEGRGSEGRRPDNSQSRPPERRPERAPEGSSDYGPPNPNSRPASADRALNVRPYSEAPKVDLPRDEGYRPPNRPEGAPSES